MNTQELIGKLPPQAIDVEEAVLGVCILEKVGMQISSELLKPEDFYVDKHQVIYENMLEMMDIGDPIDILTVTRYLRKKGKLEESGGAFYITKLTSRVNSAANTEHHCRILQELSIKRKLINFSSIIQNKAYDDQTDTFELIDEVEKEVLDITDIDSGDNTTTIYQSAKESIKQIEARMENDSSITGVPTGLKDLDSITAGFQPGFIILGARPSMGKALALDELVATPSGRVEINKLNVGDDICGTDGEVYKVEGKYPQGIRPMYEITFDDGLKVKCDENHLWEVQDRKTRKRSGKDVRIITVKEMIKEGLYVKNTNRKNFSIKYTEPVRHDSKKLLINPYILGLLLGDGSLSSKKISFTNSEQDIINVMNQYFGDRIKKEPNRNQFRINGKEIKDLLSHYNLIDKKSHEKFIPNDYLYSSAYDRKRILKGLIDTDGYVDDNQPNNIEFSTTSKLLKDNIITLVRGLGGRASYSQRKGRYKKDNNHIETRINYRVRINMTPQVIPVNSVKNISKYKTSKKYYKRFVTDIKKIDPEETVCIEVNSPDKCFLMNDYVVTHNSALSLTMARNAAVDYNMPVAFFSLEMPHVQLTTRLLSSESNIESDKFKKGTLSEEEFNKMNSKISNLIESNLIIDDTPAMNLRQFKSKARRLVQQRGIKMIIIDYLQLMSGSGKKGLNREGEIAEISRGMKKISMELKIPIIALSQLNRGLEQRGGDKRPALSDLRESGSLEQDADMVMFIYRPEHYGITEGYDKTGAPMPTNNLMELIIAKHRDGALDTVFLKFIGAKTKVLNWNDYMSMDDLPNNITPMSDFEQEDNLNWLND